MRRDIWEVGNRISVLNTNNMIHIFVFSRNDCDFFVFFSIGLKFPKIYIGFVRGGLLKTSFTISQTAFASQTCGSVFFFILISFIGMATNRPANSIILFRLFETYSLEVVVTSLDVFVVGFYCLVVVQTLRFLAFALKAYAVGVVH